MIVWPIEILQNKYTKWYEQIIEKAKEQNLCISRRQAKKYEGYTEVHHIIPRSFGGSNDKENLVRFSAREHFICHWLLTKMVSGDYRNKMLAAFVLMSGDGSKSARYNFKITSSRVFEQIRIDYAEYQRKKQSGREVSQITRDKISAANKGREHTEEWKKHVSALLKGKPGPIHTAEIKEKIGMRTRGKTFEELYGKEKAESLRESCKHIGEDNGFYGKKHSSENLLRFKEYHNDPEVKKAKSERVKGDKNPAKRLEVKEKISQSQKEKMRQDKLLGKGSYSQSFKEKQSAAHSGANNGRALTVKFTDPDGKEFIVTGYMKKFCLSNNLSYCEMIKVAKGKLEMHRGWKLSYMKKEPKDKNE